MDRDGSKMDPDFPNILSRALIKLIGRRPVVKNLLRYQTSAERQCTFAEHRGALNSDRHMFLFTLFSSSVAPCIDQNSNKQMDESKMQLCCLEKLQDVFQIQSARHTLHQREL